MEEWPTSCDLLCSPFLTPEFLILPLPRSLTFLARPRGTEKAELIKCPKSMLDIYTDSKVVESDILGFPRYFEGGDF